MYHYRNTAARNHIFALGWAIFLSVLLVGCLGTKIRSGHFLIQEKQNAPIAKVYFIRPGTERTMGVADNKLSILLDQKHLLDLVKGEYTLVHLKPGPVTATINSMTAWGPRSDIKQMSRDYLFSFADAQTYFVVLKPVDGEFRGVFFVAEEVDLAEAKRVSKRLHPMGMAKRAKIRSIDE